jgi:hypothetical protein
VLVVPVTALSVGADGSSRVQVRRGGGGTEFVTVNPGLAAEGLVEVRPVDGGLEPGDLVVVGTGGKLAGGTGGPGTGLGTTDGIGTPKSSPDASSGGGDTSPEGGTTSGASPGGTTSGDSSPPPGEGPTGPKP